jgi:NADH:ubiquinone oxidoreductase subunit 6 (subunit J)
MVWPIVIACLLGGAAVYLLVPRPERRVSAVWGAVLAAAAILWTGLVLVAVGKSRAEAVLFYAFSGIAVVAGGMLLTQRNPVHAALSFALVVLSTCGLFLIQAAPFLMAATIIVYAGAIIVTFLFVIMLAQQEGISDADYRSREPLFSTIAAFVLLGALLYILRDTYKTRSLDALTGQTVAAASETSLAGIRREIGDENAYFAQFRSEAERLSGTDSGNQLRERLDRLEEGWREPKINVAETRQNLLAVAEASVLARRQIGMLQPSGNVREALSRFSVPNARLAPNESVAPLGRSLFTDYLLPVELAGTLLLVATIGAIAIAGRRTGELR